MEVGFGKAHDLRSSFVHVSTIVLIIYLVFGRRFLTRGFQRGMLAPGPSSCSEEVKLLFFNL